MANAYFANCVTDVISVNLNSDILNKRLSELRFEPSSSPLLLEASSFAFPTAANLGKGVFGSGDGNKNGVTVYYQTQANASYFEISVAGLSGVDLYFYVFGDSIVGKTAQGLGSGITIATLVPQMTPVQ